MSTSTARARTLLLDSGHLATIVVVVLAYVVSLVGHIAEVRAGETPDFTLTAFGAASLLGVLYLLLSIRGINWLERHVDARARLVYFAIQLVLVTAIQLLLSGSGGAWLITMPLIATAATDLSGPWRWFVWLGAIASMVVPVWFFAGRDNALFAAMMMLPAAVFVIVFVRLAQTAETAQLEAERLAGELAEANHQLSAYVIQAEELATMQERNRLAREIHDNLGHYLTVVNVQIKAAQAMMDKDPARALSALEKAQQLTEDGLAAVRQSVSSLRESPLGARSLCEAIRSLAAESQAAGIVTGLTVLGEERPLDPRAELTLYRAAQEGLTNVRKHARASRVDLTVDYTNPDRVALSVVDNGIGLASAEDTGGFGLLGLRERVFHLGGTLESGPAGVNDHTHGFRLAIDLPTAVGAAAPAQPAATQPEPA